MSQSIVVTEGQHDKILLENLVYSEVLSSSVRFISAGGWSAADSLARSILVKRQSNVALVVDADTIDPHGAQERKRFLQRSLQEVALNSDWRVFVIAPEIDILLFHSQHVLEQFIKSPVSEDDFLQGQHEPKKVLTKLLRKTPYLDAYKTRLPQMDLAVMRSHPVVQELIQFLRESNRRAAA